MAGSVHVRRRAVSIAVVMLAVLLSVGGLAVGAGAFPGDPPGWVGGWLGTGDVEGMWWAESGVTVEVRDPQANLVYSGTATTLGNSFSVNISASQGYLLEPGAEITVSDESYSRTLIVAPLGVQSFDFVFDRVYGYTMPNTLVWVNIDGSGTYTTSGGDGSWVADFGAINVDLTEYFSWGVLQVFDTDGDTTLKAFHPPVVWLPPQSGTRGELEASFHAGPSASYAIALHGMEGVAMAAPQYSPPGRIRPFQDGQQFCLGSSVGLWILWFGDQAGLASVTDKFFLDGRELMERRVVKKLPGQQGPEESTHWMTEGVPVLGSLALGEHQFTWIATQIVDGETYQYTESHIFRIVDCG